MELFFELLQMSLGTRDRLSRVPSMEDWGVLYKIAWKQAVVGVMLIGIERLPSEQYPPKSVTLYWFRKGVAMERTYRKHRERAIQMTQGFRSAGFKSCVLKGVGFAQYYTQPSRRQCGDIDLWVNGRREDMMKYLRSNYPVELVVWHHVDAIIFEDVHTEIHLHPAWMYGPVRNHRLQQFFEREKDAQMVENAATGFAYTSASFSAVFSLVHTFHHFLEEGVGFRHIVDLFYILKALPTSSREDVMQEIKRVGLGKFAAATMWVLLNTCRMPSEYLLCPPDAKEGRFLLSEIAAGGNFGKTRRDGRIRNSFGRWAMMVRHYPGEVLWMVPWKLWHRCWRVLNK